MTVAVIIVAAGRGTRAGEGLPKQWRVLAGRPVLAWTVDAFAGIGRILVVLHPDDMARGAALFGGAVTLVAGGKDRSESVKNALETLDGSGVSKVLIHDGARPLVPRSVILAVLAALDAAPGAAPALAVTDALWHGTAAQVSGTQDRSGLFRAQTPQGFRLDAILAAHRAHPGGAADDVEVARAAGFGVAIVPGSEDNLKITFAADFARAEAILQRSQGHFPRKEARMDLRIGHGYDVHAFCTGDQLTLCGVTLAHDKGLLGHSDADVGMHALSDAIYGALAKGDIGRHFPPSDPQWKGAESWIFLDHAAKLAAISGYRISNADVTLVCERPKIGPHAIDMAEKLAKIMGVDASRVSVKATTSERLGFTGREEGIAALATVLLIGA